MVKERTAALEESENHLQKIFYGSPIGIAIFDTEGICLDCNESFLRLVGKKDRKQGGGNVSVGNNPALSDEMFILPFKRALDGENVKTDPIMHKSESETHWLVHSFVANISLHGEVNSIICFSEDVTDQITAHDFVQAKNKELESFVYTVSHDLKSPIFSISGLVEILEADLGSSASESVRFLLDRIQKNLKNMERMISDLQELSKVGISKAKFGVVDPSIIVQTVVLEERVRCEVEGSEVSTSDFPEIYADESQITQLFRNLISNAFKYRHKDRILRIDISYRERQDCHYFIVKDNGIGIQPGIRKNVFDPFYRIAPDEIEGTGVGLAIVKKIVENHSGRIWVESEPGKSTEFHFTLSKKPGA